MSSLGLVAQLVRAPPCHGGGRRFESDHRLCEKLDLSCFSYGWIPEWPKGTDCKSAGNAFEGSNPSPPIVLGVALSSKMVTHLL